MDLSKIIQAAEDMVGAAGGAAEATKIAAAAVPGVSQAMDAVHNAVDDAKAKAAEMGLGDMADKVENAAEQKIGLDLDGDGDVGMMNHVTTQ